MRRDNKNNYIRKIRDRAYVCPENTFRVVPQGHRDTF
jgi:hypothetical protein